MEENNQVAANCTCSDQIENIEQQLMDLQSWNSNEAII